MHARVRILVSAAAMLAAWPAPARAQLCPPPPNLPTLNCSLPNNCCVAGALNIDDLTLFGGNFACDDLAFFNSVGFLCNQTSFNDHNAVFDVITSTYAADGLNQCVPTLPYAKHWASGAFLIGGAIDYVPGTTWHHPIQDYLAASVAESNDIKPALEHVLGSANSPNAQHMHDGVFADTITFFCPLFGNTQVGTPAYRASDFIHEAWHMVYGNHDTLNIPGGGNQDFFYPHDHVLGPGQVGDCFEPSKVPVGASGSFDCRVGTVPDYQTSVYQLHYEYLCDLNTTPHEWLPRSIAMQAGSLTFQLENVWNNGQGVFKNPPPFFCNFLPPLRDPRGPAVPGRPRRLVLNVEGHLVETAELPQDDDDLFLDEDDVLPLEVSAEALNASATWESPHADEVWVEVRASATMQNDGDTVIVRYNVFFFEEDQDGTDCDMDLTGYDCPGLNDQTNWPSVTLSSSAFVLPPVPVHLNNEGNENGDDKADLLLFFELDW